MPGRSGCLVGFGEPMLIFVVCAVRSFGLGAWWWPGCLAGCAGFHWPGDVLVGGRWLGGGGGAADVDGGGCGVGGDVVWGVGERLPGFDLVGSVAVSVGGDPGGGDG